MSLTVIYIIGAVAVIALVVLVLVLRTVQAGKEKALAEPEPAFSEAEPGWASGPDTWPADDEPPATDAKPSATDALPATDTQPVVYAPSATDTQTAGHATLAGYTGSVGYTGPADDAESTVYTAPAVQTTSAEPPATAMFVTDPVLVLVNALLQNSGELNPAEFRRLELYRPQRIVDAVDALAPKLTGRADESKRSRLQRIRQYAVSLMAAFESGQKDLVGERAVTPGVATVEPEPIAPLAPLETTQVVPPEEWGAPIDGSKLTLDSELSVQHDDLSPAPDAEAAAVEAEVAPASAPPAEHGVDDLASMSPREIGRALTLSDDIEFKRAAIEAIEHLGTPEALSQLQDTLEDPDPDVQLYALSAAERLLGRGGRHRPK